jgi:hypothetical protein
MKIGIPPPYCTSSAIYNSLFWFEDQRDHVSSFILHISSQCDLILFLLDYHQVIDIDPGVTGPVQSHFHIIKKLQ